MRRSSDGRFVAPCHECLLRYKRNRDFLEVFGLGALIVLAAALIWTCQANGWL